MRYALDFDPATDLAVDRDNGLLRWTDDALRHKPEMVRKVAGYFSERKEDD